MDELQRAVEWLEYLLQVKEANARTYPHRAQDVGAVHHCRALLDTLRWIPISERLPEEMEVCLCAKQRGGYGQSAVVIAQHQGDGRWSSMGLGGVSVTHWMPLPKPPESEG